MKSNKNLQIYLKPTEFIDSDSPAVKKFVSSVISGETSDIGKAIKLYYAVRDTIYYDPYRIDLSKRALTGTAVLDKKYGFCITKAILLAAAVRAAGIPSRLGFADVKNHLTTTKLRQLMKTDIFTYHGYTEMYLEAKWVKATPAFNISLCEKFGVKPLEFDGIKDSIFHEFDKKGNRHMEYIRDHGLFADLPYHQMIASFKQHYPALFTKKAAEILRSFEKEASREN